jgi:hypothetical protein
MSGFFSYSLFMSVRRTILLVAFGMFVLWVRIAAGQEYSAVANAGTESTVAESSAATAEQSAGAKTERPESELAFMGQESFGHFHIFANSWWSDLGFASIEYDRHSWGRALGARLDYAAEIQPLVVLRQLKYTTVYGNNSGDFQRETVYGIGIMPIGTRLLWRDGKSFKPYFVAKGGVLGFNKKALSQYSSYMDWSLEFGLGTQFRLSSRWDGRVGFNYFHFSNGFIVPSNPGLDSAMYTGGLAYHLGGRSH